MRAVSAGLITRAAMKRAMIAAFAVATLFGLYLVRDGGLADRRDRHRVDRRGHRVHRRSVAARLSRPRRRVRARVLRLRRGVRHGVRAARPRARARDAGRRCPSARSRPRSSSSTTCAIARPTRASASARSRCGSAGAARSSSTRCCSPSPTPCRSASPAARTTRGALLPLDHAAARLEPAARSCQRRDRSRAQRAASPRPHSCCSCTAHCSRSAWWFDADHLASTTASCGGRSIRAAPRAAHRRERPR